MTAELVWEDPPPSGGGWPANTRPGRWQLLAAELKKHPGKWAIALTAPSKNGRSASARAMLKKAGCETAERNIDGTLTVYARWPENAT